MRAFYCIALLLASLLASGTSAFALSCGFVDYVVPGQEPPVPHRRSVLRSLALDNIVFVGRYLEVTPVGPRPLLPFTSSAEPRFFVVRVAVERNLRNATRGDVSVLVVVGHNWPAVTTTNREAERSVRYMVSNPKAPLVFLIDRPNSDDVTTRDLVAKHRIDGLATLGNCASGIRRYEPKSIWGEYYIRALTPEKGSAP